MSLEALLEKVDIFDELGYQDSLTLEKAKEIIETVPTATFSGGDNTDQVWFKNNLNSQKDLLNLKARLSFVRNNLELESKVSYGDSLESERDDLADFRSKAERESLILSRDDTIRDKAESLIKIDSILQYAEGLLWVLRDLSRLYNK